MRAWRRHQASRDRPVVGEERFAQSLTLDDLQFLLADG